MKTNKKIKKEITKAESRAVAVKEPKPIAESQIAATIRELYRDVLVKNEEAFWARAKLGAVLIRWEEFLGKSKGGYESAGDGLKGWLEKNCPEIGYESARSYKASARMAATMIGNGAVAIAALLGEETVMQPDGEVIDIPADVIEKRDNLYKDVKSRRKLEQAYFDFMNGDGAQQGGKKRTKGLVMEEPKAKLPAAQFAHAKWSAIIVPAVKKCSRLVRLAASLTVDDAQDAIDALRPLMDALRERVKEG